MREHNKQCTAQSIRKQLFPKFNYKFKKTYQINAVSGEQKMEWITDRGINTTAFSHFLILKL